MAQPSAGFHRIPGGYIVIIVLYAEPPFDTNASFTQRFVSHAGDDGSVYWTPDGPGIRMIDFSVDASRDDDDDANLNDLKVIDITNQVYDHPDNITFQ
jgi:hypothetical protein